MKLLFFSRQYKEKNFQHPPPGASVNETTISLKAIQREKFILHLLIPDSRLQKNPYFSTV